MMWSRRKEVPAALRPAAADLSAATEAILRDAQGVPEGHYSPARFRMPGTALLGVFASIASILGLYALMYVVLSHLTAIETITLGRSVIRSDHALFVSSFLFTIFGVFVVLYFMSRLLFAYTDRYNDLYTKYVAVLRQNTPLFQAMRAHNSSLERLRSMTSFMGEWFDTSPDDDDGRFLAQVIEGTRSIFERITGDRCAVCIKSYDFPDNKRITTLVRDELSQVNRRHADTAEGLQSYPIVANTAFRDIVDPTKPDSSFICNDLRALAAEGQYQNANPHWARFYNACAVVPIYSEFRGDLRQGIFGFLCVDNKNGGFEEEIALPILRIVANLLYLYLASAYQRIQEEEYREEQANVTGGEHEDERDSLSGAAE